MPNYQTIPSGATRFAPHRGTRERLLHRIKRTLLRGFWWCNHCQSATEREEGEQGQPAHCATCGSPRIHWHAPVRSAELLVGDTTLIQPGDL